MTPRQLHALHALYFERLQREELLVGIVAAAVTNSGFCRPEQPVSPEHFMLHPIARPTPEPVNAPAGVSLRALVAALPRGAVRKG